MANGRPTIASAIFYRDPRGAIELLKAAFGFELVTLIETPDGNLAHSQMALDGATIMVGGEWMADVASPASVGGKNTQFIHIHIAGDIDAHCEQARAAGMTITQEPQDQFFGDRTYRCKDPEGHMWVVAQTVKTVTREEAEAATGFKITGWA
ncbi:MAG TPA: glyoxalase/bleomycin resistance/extradiol dioxygenase family protein [Caulobacteraceae bacterium]